MTDTKTITTCGVPLAVAERGEGPVVLLVHGFPLDHSMWNAQLDAVSTGFRVIAPDLRGFGRSGVADGKVTMAQMADDLAGLLDALEVPGPVVFCGLSMGGYVAWEFWRRHAGRLRGLVLCDTRAAADSPDAAAARLDTAETVLREGPAALVEGMLPKLFAGAVLQSRPPWLESVRRVMLGTDPQGIAAAARGMAERADFTPMLGQIGCPALVVVGEKDAISPVDEMRSIAEALPDARLAVIPQAGHMSPMENPEAVNKVLGEFLRSLG